MSGDRRPGLAPVQRQGVEPLSVAEFVPPPPESAASVPELVRLAAEVVPPPPELEASASELVRLPAEVVPPPPEPVAFPLTVVPAPPEPAAAVPRVVLGRRVRGVVVLEASLVVVRGAVARRERRGVGIAGAAPSPAAFAVLRAAVAFAVAVPNFSGSTEPVPASLDPEPTGPAGSGIGAWSPPEVSAATAEPSEAPAEPLPAASRSCSFWR